MILLKTKPLVALGTGIVLAAIFAFIFQGDVLDAIIRISIPICFKCCFN